MASSGYIGRFAPSPTGPLHAGSLAAAFASWLDARAHGGRWLVRIEDVDGPRCVPGGGQVILAQLAACGLMPDEPPLWQSNRDAAYVRALARLIACGWAYPCGCTRREVEEAIAQRDGPRERHGELVYPGTCRQGLQGRPARAMRALAAATNEPPRAGASARPPAPLAIAWADRRLGPQLQDVSDAVGDFVLKRADGLWAYQLAVVVDDHAQGISHIVRGEDLADNTARQIHLQRLLGAPTPIYLHTPLVPGANGEKLSKQNGAAAFDHTRPVDALRQAGDALGLALRSDHLGELLAEATAAWGARWASDTIRR